ncbi:PilZ domain-containing protein [Methylobacter sp.]|uniref:PilZ domain-containing protein n=1 Tax=Methylobacter sp. TaxID=2051955 RepID=UPI002488D921|nr:PilZ domain-containing protein [Methylobacter sp.]MDI1276854.1 PilZ domain-containing protein [Methylobacter sp.]MDI1357520.1 PilZ domain-containing protein [Methylobacter sp.]
MERRLYQRIPVQVSAIVTTEDGVRIKVSAVDVSSDGLGIECNIKQRNMITPGGSFVRDGKPVSVFVDLDLSDRDGHSSKIVAKCQVAFSRRMSSDQCKIGLRYADIENNSHEWLVRFIEKRLVPN